MWRNMRQAGANLEIFKADGNCAGLITPYDFG
jgi:hypothetical protein